MEELATNGVQIYQFPVDDETVAEMNVSMNAHFPFAVCGSTDFIRVGNKMVRARQYPWGTVQGISISIATVYTLLILISHMLVENEKHCDFVKLREMLIRTNMEDLRETTHVRHYEIYRRLRLEQVLIFFSRNFFLKVIGYKIFIVLSDGFQRRRF